MAASIHKIEDLDLSLIEFAKSAKSIDNQLKMVAVTYKKKPLVIQSPMMPVTNVFAWDSGKSSIDFGADPLLEGFMTTLGQRCKEEVFANVVSWYKRRISSMAEVSSMFTPMIRKGGADGGGPVFRANLPMADGKFLFETYSADDRSLVPDVDGIQLVGRNAVAILQCSGIWMNNGKFGMSWKVAQLKVFGSLAPVPKEVKVCNDENDDDAPKKFAFVLDD
jgi:hypothetical protein